MNAQVLVACVYCHREVDPDARSTYQLVVGWHRPGHAGGSDSCRQKRQKWACDICVGRMKRDVSPHQEGLL